MVAPALRGSATASSPEVRFEKLPCAMKPTGQRYEKEGQEGGKTKEARGDGRNDENEDGGETKAKPHRELVTPQACWDSKQIDERGDCQHAPICACGVPGRKAEKHHDPLP
jgi:hypothetical protein